MSDSRRFGVIGTGVWGETHLMAYSTHPGAEVRIKSIRHFLQQRSGSKGATGA